MTTWKMSNYLIRLWDYIKFLWEKVFSKNYCEICNSRVEYNGAAMCLIHDEGNMYICETCVENAWKESMDPVFIESEIDVQ